jgi:hypothetical protein
MIMAGERPRPALRRSAEILFVAKVTADELRFRTAPENSVVFTGDAADESTAGSVRTHLPDKVATNITYRDIQVDYAIASKLAEDS